MIIENITFQGNNYPIRPFKFKENDIRFVSVISLKEKLQRDDKSNAIRAIVYYFVPDEMIKTSDKALKKFIKEQKNV